MSLETSQRGLGRQFGSEPHFKLTDAGAEPISSDFLQYQNAAPVRRPTFHRGGEGNA
jgi:hypothetical protein